MMWFLLYAVAAFYDLIVEPLLGIFTAETVPFIADIIVFALIAFIFFVSGTKRWIVPFILFFITEQVPVLGLILPGHVGIIYKVHKNQSKQESPEDNKKEEEVGQRETLEESLESGGIEDYEYQEQQA